MSQKWKLLPTLVQELKDQEDESYDPLINKLDKLKSLKDKVDGEEAELKLQYILLMRERNEYHKKLKQVQQLIESNPNTQLAQQVQQLFDAINQPQ